MRYKACVCKDDRRSNILEVQTSIYMNLNIYIYIIYIKNGNEQ